jgi:hypothetical protein
LQAILSSLRAFAAAGLRPRTPLAKAVVLVLCIKLIGVLVMQLIAVNYQPAVDASAMAHAIGVALSAPTHALPR